MVHKWMADVMASKRSSFPAPSVIGDTMPATEQVDGRFYESKRAFRAVGRALGLTEVGDQKLPPKRYTPRPGRREAIKEAVERYNSGQRPRSVNPID
jgi:hypothetical protein